VSTLPAPTAARRLARGVAALAVSAAFLTACGAGSTDAGASGTTSAGTSTETSGAASGSTEGDAITATEKDFSISLGEDHLAAGTYDIEVVNKGHATHDLVVAQNGADVAKTDTIAPGESATLTVTLASGKYVFYCSIGNHRSMGMQTTVSVS
jgi:uncharacterized cupredoxin-like copper-binding protein